MGSYPSIKPIFNRDEKIIGFRNVSKYEGGELPKIVYYTICGK